MSNQIFLADSIWEAGTDYVLGQQIAASGYIQQVTTPGTSGGTIPIFSDTTGNTTSDNPPLEWTCTGPTSARIWIVPTNFNSSNTIECIGAGGAGGAGLVGVAGGGGGGGYGKISNLSLTPGDMIPYSLGAGSNSGPGGDTWFNGSDLISSPVGGSGGLQGNAAPGVNSAIPIQGGEGGNGVGTTTQSGGRGGSAVTASGGGRPTGSGGGGAGGPHGNGGNGGDTTSSSGTGAGQSGGGGNGGGGNGGVAINTYSNGGNNYLGYGGGVSGSGNGVDGGGGYPGGFPFGGNGGNGIDWTDFGSGGGGGGGGDGGGDGGLYGGGGGGAGGGASGTPGHGAPGIIVITYELSISCGNPPIGVVGQPYSLTLPTSFGTPPYTFSLDSSSGVTAVTGTLPISSSGGSTPDISIADATSSTVGVVQPDNTTITILDGVISASVAGLVPTARKYLTSWSSQTSVIVTHNLGTSSVLVQVYDSSGNLVNPQSIIITGVNVVTLIFGASFTGSAVVIGFTSPAASEYNETFSSATSVTVTHNLGTSNVFVMVYDSIGNQVIPQNIAITDSNNVTLTFGASFSGSVVVVGLAIPVNEYYTSWISQTSVTVTHNLNTTSVIVQVYDSSGNQAIPQNVAITDANNVTLTFGASFTGSVVVMG